MENLAQYGNTLDLIDRAVYFRDNVIPVFADCEVIEMPVPVDYLSSNESMNFNASFGLCYNLSLYDTLTNDCIRSLFKSWVYFSGDILYPIPDPDFLKCDIDHQKAKSAYYSTPNLYRGVR